MGIYNRYSFAERRCWSERYLQKVRQGIVSPSLPGLRHPCPCCGYPTLPERESWEICSLCGWQDDGQDDPHADEVWGGPNYEHSLSEARENFSKYLIMYDPYKKATRIGGNSNTPTQHKAKRGMVEAFAKMLTETDQATLDTLWHHVLAYEKMLELELYRIIREYEARFKRS